MADTVGLRASGAAGPVERHASGASLTAVVDGVTEFAVLAFAAWTLIYDVGLALRLTTVVLLLLWAACLVVVAAALVRVHRPTVQVAAGRSSRPDSPVPLAGPAWQGYLAPAGVISGVAAGVAAGAHAAGLPWVFTWALGALSVCFTATALVARDRAGPGGDPPDPPVGAGAGGDPPDPPVRAGAGGDPPDPPVRAGAGGDPPDPPVRAGAGGSAPDSAVGARTGGRTARSFTGPTARAAGAAVPPHRSLLAFVTALGLAGLSLFIFRPDGDDAYFVSRSVWTAQHGRIPVKDILFTNQATNHFAGEPPVASIEVLNGALARELGIQAATFTYYVALPVATFFAVWAVWLLIRRWTPARPVVCFAVAMVYLLWSGTSGASFGSFHLVRMWQGKAVFVSAMVPLLYAYLTHWAEHRSRRGLLLSVAASIAAVGLSSAAVIVVPLVAAAVVGPLLLARQVKTGLTAALAAAYPLAAGLGVAALDPVHLPGSAYMPAPAAWSWVMLTGVLGAITGIALWTSPWLTRRGVPALITTGIAAVATLVLVPGFLALISHLTGAGLVNWRLLWAAPGPVLVGLLAAIPIPAGIRIPGAARQRPGAARLSPAALRWLALVPALAVCALILANGRVVWSHGNGGAKIASRPSWKYDQYSLLLARKALQADHRAGYLLSTQRIMSAIPLITTEVRAMNGRSYYLHLLPAQPAVHRGPGSAHPDGGCAAANAVGGRRAGSAGAGGSRLRVRLAVQQHGAAIACGRRFHAGNACPQVPVLAQRLTARPEQPQPSRRRPVPASRGVCPS